MGEEGERGGKGEGRGVVTLVVVGLSAEWPIPMQL